MIEIQKILQIKKWRSSTEYLGKNLGAQKYISRLVNEKPNLTTRMYKLVKEKLSNIRQSKETINMKKYTMNKRKYWNKMGLINH